MFCEFVNKRVKSESWGTLGRKLLANISIHRLPNVLQITVAHFNWVLKMWCVFSLCVINYLFWTVLLYY